MNQTPKLESQLLNLLDGEKNVQAQNEEDPLEDEPNAHSNDTLHDDSFTVKGSYHEER